jgi:hypothetical protein
MGPTTNFTTCASCPEGTHGPSLGIGCLPCPTGTYSPSIGSETCDACPNGLYCPVRSALALSNDVRTPSIISGTYNATATSALNSQTLASFLITGGIGLLALLIAVTLLALASSFKGKRAAMCELIV